MSIAFELGLAQTATKMIVYLLLPGAIQFETKPTVSNFKNKFTMPSFGENKNLNQSKILKAHHFGINTG